MFACRMMRNHGIPTAEASSSVDGDVDGARHVSSAVPQDNQTAYET